MTGLFIFTFIVSSYGQKKINTALKNELDSLYQKDQGLRELISSGLLQTSADSIADSYKIPKSELINYIVKTIPIIDSLNLLRIEQILKQYGYPGISLVGTGTNEAAFYILQHAQNIDKYLPTIKKAVDNNELSFKLYAMMLDRSLMYKGKEQIYGTQGKGFEMLNAETGEKEFKNIIWPIKDPLNVNDRRKKAGFNLTIEAYSKQQLGIDYKVLSLKDVKNMQGH
jgi:hypothetical protein